MRKAKFRIAILISGNGSNLQAIIDAVNQGTINAEIVLVLSNKAEAYGLTRAHRANLPTQVLLNTDYASRDEYDAALKKILDQYQPDLIVLAGFMRILSENFVSHFQGKLINIHPSLLPKYKGLNTHQRVLDAGDKLHGVTIHYVTSDLDGGPIIEQVSLEILPNDTAESLEERIHQLEHKLYPQVIAKLANSTPTCKNPNSVP